MFEEKLYKVRENAGYICDLLSITVAFVNQQYFVHGQTNQIQKLSEMKKVPENFIELYRRIIAETSPDNQKRLCYDLIKSTKSFLDSQEKITVIKSTPDFSELAAWYQELCYTWRRVYHWCDKNDSVNSYIWCCMLQNEVDEWGAKFGIAGVDILSSFKENDLAGFRKQVAFVEEKFKQAIKESGAKLDEYKTVEDFLRAN